MILFSKGNCIISGVVTSKGGEMTFIGERQTPKYRFSVRYENKKDENGEWTSKYLDCEILGKDTEKAPDLSGGEKVLCAGCIEERTWTDREGNLRKSTTLKCDFVTVSNGHMSGMGQPMESPSGFCEIGDDDEGDLPF